jgi:hypothetical protein
MELLFKLGAPAKTSTAYISRKVSYVAQIERKPAGTLQRETLRQVPRVYVPGLSPLQCGRR